MTNQLRLNLRGKDAIIAAEKAGELEIRSTRSKKTLSIAAAKTVSGYTVIDGEGYSEDDFYFEVDYTPTTWIALGDTYPAKDQIKAAGGKWDKENKRWVLGKEPTVAIAGVAFCPSPLPVGWWIYDSISKDLQPGQVFLTPLGTTGRRNDYKVCLAQWADKTFSDYSERWENCTSTLARPATDVEWSAYQEAKDQQNAKAAKKSAARTRLIDLIRTANFEEPLPKILSGDRLEFRLRSSPDFAILTEDRVYYGSYNGADGDDWRFNNWNGYVVSVAPASPEIKVAFEDVKSLWGAL